MADQRISGMVLHLAVKAKERSHKRYLQRVGAAVVTTVKSGAMGREAARD